MTTDVEGGGPATRPAPRKGNFFKRHEATIAFATAVLAAFGAYLAWASNKATERLTRAETYLTLRNNYYEVSAQLPARYRDEAYRPELDSDEWRRIKRYWYHSFDEWFITTRLNPADFGSLWDDYYSKAIGTALEKPALRHVACHMVEREFQAEQTRAFAEELRRRYPGKAAGAMCPVPAPTF